LPGTFSCGISVKLEATVERLDNDVMAELICFTFSWDSSEDVAEQLLFLESLVEEGWRNGFILIDPPLLL
jgi:hypothetical protein